MRFDQSSQAMRPGSKAARQPGNHTNRHPGADPVDVAISLCAHRKFSLRYSGYRLRLECHSASWPTCNCIVYGLPHKRRVNSPPPSRCLPLSLARSSNGKFIWHANIFLPHIPFTLAAAAVAVSVFDFRFLQISLMPATACEALLHRRCICQVDSLTEQTFAQKSRDFNLSIYYARHSELINSKLLMKERTNFN